MSQLPTSTRDQDRDSATSSHASWLTRLLSCSAFIAVGIVLSVLVAWACALWSPIPEEIESLSYVRSQSRPEIFETQRQLWAQDKPASFPNQPDFVTPYEFGFGVRKIELGAYGDIPTMEELCGVTFEEIEKMTDEEIDKLPENEYEIRSYDQNIITAGWPLHSMQMSIWDEVIETNELTTETNFITDGFAIGGSLDEVRMLPLRPVAWGMLVSAIFWGGLAFLGFRGVNALTRKTSLLEPQSIASSSIVESL